MMAALRRIWHALLDLLFPGDVQCLCCGDALHEADESGLCTACVRALEALEAAQQARREEEPLPEGVDAVYAVYPYTGQARRLILRMKFQSVRDAADVLGRQMAYLPGGEADLLVPVPTTKRRRRQRGFNQAELLCQAIAQETGMPMACALSRKDDRVAQSLLSGQSRKHNLAGCMQATDTVCGQRIVLVDDVYTTGATAKEAARALRQAGATGVAVFAAARALDPKEKEKAAQLPFDVKKT